MIRQPGRRAGCCTGGNEAMHKKAFQLIVDNTSGVLSRISGLFSRRGYNIESITAGVTADPRFTRITIVASGDDEILDQIEKQVGKLVDVRDIREPEPDSSVFRELALIKVGPMPRNGRHYCCCKRVPCQDRGRRSREPGH